MSNEQLVLAPASIPQEQFLASESTITLYSGTVGAGKSFAIILNMIKFAMRQNSTIICFRRTSPQLRLPGGIWREASTVFRKAFGKDVIIRDRDMEIFLPKYNSIIKFAPLQYQSDVINHLGAQFSVIIFDEAVTFDPFDEFILPLLGRLRNANVDYKPQMFLATNPKYNHGIYHWIKDFYLDEYGIPLAEKSNIERYFVLEDNKPVWFDTREEAEAIYGSGDDSGVCSFRSIRAHVTDNKPLLKSNPTYLSNLKALPDIKRKIFLDGSWTAREEEAGLFKREWCKTVPYFNANATKRVRSYDLASQPVSSQSPNPDWTRGVLISKDDNSTYTVEDVVGIRDRPLSVDKLIIDTAKQDMEMYGANNYFVSLPCDPGAAGTSRANELKKKLAEIGVQCKVIKPQKAKRTRFLPFSAVAEAGYVNIVKGEWYEAFCSELEEFTGLVRHERDDQVDCCSDAILALNQTIHIPDFSLPDLTTSNAFNNFQ